jgi:hypothetical protein
MAKKKEKGAKKKDSAGPRDAVRGAVESTFQRAAGGASKAQDLLDEIATTLKALRDANLVETLEGVRDEVQSLAKRVAALELRSAEPEKPAPKRPAVRRTATSSTTAARKPAARKPAAKKPAAKKAAAPRKPATAKRAAAPRKPAASKKAS